MKALYVSLSILNHDGRQRELLEVLSSFSNIDIIAPSLAYKPGPERGGHGLKIKTREDRSSLMFYLKLVFYALRMSFTNSYDFIFIDDYQSSLVGLVLKLFNRKAVFVVDCREFYYGRTMPGLGRWLLRGEKIIIKKADVIIAANKYRANLMRILYGVKMPLIFENIRALEGVDSKIKGRDSKGNIRLVSTGGCSIERGTLKLVEAVGNKDGIELLIVGEGGRKDQEAVNRKIVECNYENVKVVNRVPFEKLCEILSDCDGGVIEYHLNDLNNYFCASGKIYEYLSLGIPVLTTPNPPLVDFVEKNKCGVSGDDWSEVIRCFLEEYERWKAGALKFKPKIDIIENRRIFSNELSGKVRSIIQGRQ